MFEDDGLDRWVPEDCVVEDGVPVGVVDRPLVLGVAELYGREPGADLAWLLEIGSVQDATDAALVEAVAAWQRMVSWAAAGAARAAAVLAERASMNPVWPESAGAVSEPNVAGEELAMRLACSRRAARTLVRDGRAFGGALSMTGSALARGEIDPVKARVLVEALDRDVVPVRLAVDVQEAVLEGASGWTPTQLARQVAGALIAADPAGARARHEAARRGRRVDRPRVLADGMAGVWAVLDAVDAVELDARIDAVARSARNAGDPRTLDQLRADVLVGHLAHAAATVPVGTATAATAPIEDPAPAEASEPPERAVSGAGPDHAVRAGPASSSAADDATTAPERRWPRSQVRVTVPLSTLIGTDDAPGELAGYGPITAEAARALASGGVWRRLVTDPTSGAVLDVGRTRYRPPADLAEHVRVRDRTCARAGCPTPATSCELDHTVEYHRHGGTTSDDDLGPLCTRDHLVKTDGGFSLTQAEPGVFRWITPTGHIHDVRPGTDRPRRHQPPAEDRPPPF